MAIKRLYEGFGVGEDSCVEGRNPLTEQDIRAGTEGVYLGPNPESPSKGLFLTYWEADEVAQKIGFPHIAVYAEQKLLIDQQAQEIADLKHQLENEVHSLQVEAVAKEIRKSNKELLGEIQSYNAAARARIGDSGSNGGTAPKPARVAGGAKAG